MSKRGQKTTSNEGSPMAKARPFLVARVQRSEEIFSRSLGYLVKMEKADERKEVVLASRKLVRECQLPTDSDERKFSISNSTRKLAASSPELRNMEYTNHPYMCKIFQFLQKKLGMSVNDATFSTQAYETNLLIWGM